MLLKNYRPIPRLVVKNSTITHPRFPVIDFHTHLGVQYGQNRVNQPVSELVRDMELTGVQAVVDLDGAWGEDILNLHLEKLKKHLPERYHIYGGVDWDAWQEHGNAFGEWAADRMRAQAARGAEGFKVWKVLGLTVRDHKGTLVPVNDHRLDPIWQTAGELGLPMMLHVADPVAFFQPVDETNERWEELRGEPWEMLPPESPTFDSIIEAMADVVRRHPSTTFIGAHVGCYAENLGWVAALMDEAPNFYIDISARLAELGRQPYTARRFFLNHADRILFGLDGNLKPDFYSHYYRFLETDDEYFDYLPFEIPVQGRWQIYGIHLPDDVLKKIYCENALRLLEHN